MKLRNSKIKQLFLDLSVLLIIAGIVSVVIFWNKRQPREWSLPENVAPLRIRSGPQNVRLPTVNGQFYPLEAEELYDTIRRLMASSPSIGIKKVRAILVPHAGYVYSAEVAAASFREVSSGFRKVFILASNHNSQADFSGVSIPAATHYSIPGVDIPLSAIIDDLQTDPLFVTEPQAHTMHMIEVELPFLYYLHNQPAEPEFTIIPMIVGRMDKSQIKRLTEILKYYMDQETLFVFSVDLSHYYPDQQARQLDTYTIQSILSRDIENLNHATTDGNQVLLTMLSLANQHSWEPTFLMYRNSGDVSGDKSRVVGYAAIVFSEPFYLTDDERRDLLGYARNTIDKYLRNGLSSEPDSDLIMDHPIFQIPRGVFVTLKKDGQLRGCIGDIIPSGPLYKSVRSCAIKAAVSDPRFEPLSIDELEQLSMSISILDFPSPVRVEHPEDLLNTLKPITDGVILVHQGRQSTFLPYVWRDIPEPREFLSRLCLKQGSPADCWQDSTTTVYSYRAYEFNDEVFLP